MPRLSAIIRTTAREMLSEPLSLLVLIAALAIEVLAPAFHYHQFGEATRMARDACFSALYTCGTVFAVFSTIRAFRREVESGTLEMALARPVSRTGFFLAKALGALVAYAAFAATVFAAGLVMVAGAAIGGVIAQQTGDVARIYGPCFAAGVGAIVLPLVAGAALDRFARFRFVPTAFALALVVSFASAAWFADIRLLSHLAPVAVLIVAAATVPLAAAAAFSFRFRANGAAAACGIVIAAMLPAMGGYFLSDDLSGGGVVPWEYVWFAVLATAPAVIFFLVLGAGFIKGRDAA